MNPVLWVYGSVLVDDAIGEMHSRFGPLRYFMSNGCDHWGGRWVMDGGPEGLLLAASSVCGCQNDILTSTCWRLRDVSCSTRSAGVSPLHRPLTCVLGQ